MPKLRFTAAYGRGYDRRGCAPNAWSLASEDARSLPDCRLQFARWCLSGRSGRLHDVDPSVHPTLDAVQSACRI
jgi:hypothetical protein